MPSPEPTPDLKKFPDLQPGDFACVSKHFTSADIDSFAEFSGDHNPIHTNDEYARRLGFRSKLVHAAELHALLSQILGTRLPGPGNLCLTQSFRFPHPVYAGDTVAMRVTVTQKFAALQTLVLKIEATNQTADIVYTGEAKVKVLQDGK